MPCSWVPTFWLSHNASRLSLNLLAGTIFHLFLSVPSCLVLWKIFFHWICLHLILGRKKWVSDLNFFFLIHTVQIYSEKQRDVMIWVSCGFVSRWGRLLHLFYESPAGRISKQYSCSKQGKANLFYKKPEIKYFRALQASSSPLEISNLQFPEAVNTYFSCNASFLLSWHEKVIDNSLTSKCGSDLTELYNY